LIIEDSLKAFKLSSKNKSYYLFSSPVKQATGLAVNFTTWLVVDREANIVFEFKSLSESYKAFYLEKKTEKMNFISLTF